MKLDLRTITELIRTVTDAEMSHSVDLNIPLDHGRHLHILVELQDPVSAPTPPNWAIAPGAEKNPSGPLPAANFAAGPLTGSPLATRVDVPTHAH